MDEQTLSAYIDNELLAEEAAAVKAYLASNPEANARVRSYEEFTALISQTYKAMLEQPVPERLRTIIETWHDEDSSWKPDNDSRGSSNEGSLAPAG